MRTSNLYCFKAIQYSNKFIFSNYKLYVCHYINHKYILFTCSEYIMYLSVLSTYTQNQDLTLFGNAKNNKALQLFKK